MGIYCRERRPPRAGAGGRPLFALHGSEIYVRTPNADLGHAGNRSKDRSMNAAEIQSGERNGSRRRPRAAEIEHGTTEKHLLLHFRFVVVAGDGE
ncbi:hypothetical protein EVAR_69786_1 [Eumeta japonica]|uniref:Uncharacterized protein n=1 Tax=Eumeta variegata TaxID=151549 RepID=A0A4C2A4J4_EUMVA|nr:hypothetical protein EVAR_69786_1 [Eumeta japonica]